MYAPDNFGRHMGTGHGDDVTHYRIMLGKYLWMMRRTLQRKEEICKLNDNGTEWTDRQQAQIWDGMLHISHYAEKYAQRLDEINFQWQDIQRDRPIAVKMYFKYTRLAEEWKERVRKEVFVDTPVHVHQPTR